MNDLKISIIGYGKMGRQIETVASSKGIEIVSIIDPNYSHKFKEISEESVGLADVCIDFTTPDAVVDNINKLIELGKKVVVGTTGWYSHLDEVKRLVDSSKIGMIYSPNFSLGVNLYLKILENASALLGKTEEYSVYGLELHHKNKLDSPSGTAKQLERIIRDNFREEVHFSSVRAGYIPGTHEVGFDSESDIIILTHIVRDRKCFASGALLAAEFIRDKQGFYSIYDYINYLMEGKNENK